VERVKEYVLRRKKPVTLQELMDRFLISQGTAYRVVNSLLSEGKVRRFVRNRKTHFQSNPTGNRPGSGKSLGRKTLLFLQYLEESRQR
jgi:Fe2+ or Zn2+ uptake regulation protein